MTKSFACVITLSAVLHLYSLIFPEKACAYIDPGSGSYILQLVIASLLSVLFTVKTFRDKVRDFFKNVFGRGKRK